jgi:hypothetical protein
MSMSLVRVAILFCALAVTIGCDKDEPPFPNNETPDPSDSTGFSFVRFDSLHASYQFNPSLTACNGHPQLCDRRINEVFFAMTHNSHAHSGAFSPLAANQNGDVTAQLDAGIRGLNIKPYWVANASCGNGAQGLYLYHGNPILGCQPFEDYLLAVRQFILDHPLECLVMTIEGGASAQRLDSIFNHTGIAQLMFRYQGGMWPTLGEMIISGKRLVVLSDRSDAESFVGQHRMWHHMVDVNYDIQNTSQFDCDFDRGNPNGAFFLLNHFLTNITPQAGSAAQTNAYALLYDRALQCWQANGKRPNFVMVDFYATGDVVRVVDSLNLLH